MGRRILRFSTELVRYILEKGVRNAQPLEPLAGARVTDARLASPDVIELAIESEHLPDLPPGTPDQLFNPVFRDSTPEGLCVFLVGSGATIARDGWTPQDPARIRAVVGTSSSAWDLCKVPGDWFCPLIVGDPIPPTVADAIGFVVPFGWLDVPFDLGASDPENPNGEVAGS